MGRSGFVASPLLTSGTTDPSPSALLASAIRKRRAFQNRRDPDMRVETILGSAIKRLCAEIGRSRTATKPVELQQPPTPFLTGSSVPPEIASIPLPDDSPTGSPSASPVQSGPSRFGCATSSGYDIDMTSDCCSTSSPVFWSGIAAPPPPPPPPQATDSHCDDENSKPIGSMTDYCLPSTPTRLPKKRKISPQEFASSTSTIQEGDVSSKNNGSSVESVDCEAPARKQLKSIQRQEFDAHYGMPEPDNDTYFEHLMWDTDASQAQMVR